MRSWSSVLIVAAFSRTVSPVVARRLSARNDRNIARTIPLRPHDTDNYSDQSNTNGQSHILVNIHSLHPLYLLSFVNTLTANTIRPKIPTIGNRYKSVLYLL